MPVKQQGSEDKPINMVRDKKKVHRTCAACMVKGPAAGFKLINKSLRKNFFSYFL